MFRTILVPTDGSPLSDRAINAAVEFAKEFGGKIIGLSVAEPYPFSPLSGSSFTDERSIYESRAREVAQEYARGIAAAAHVVDVPCETVVTQSFSPADEIISIARQHACDIIFMASRGRKGLESIFIGSVTHKVLSGSDIPVMVFR